MKKLISIIIAMSLLCTAIPIHAQNDFIFDVENGTIIGYNGNITNELTIPSHIGGVEVKSIGYAAFIYNNLTDLIIQEGIINIGEGAFFGCNQLENITLPTSLMNVGDSAFRECENLKNIYYAGSEEEFNLINISRYYNNDLKNANVYFDTIPGQKFSQNKISGKWLEDFYWDFENGTLNIYGKGPMQDIVVSYYEQDRYERSVALLPDGIQNIIIHEGITEIGAWSFVELPLESITIPKSVKRIGYGAMSSCKTIYYNGTEEELEKIVHEWPISEYSQNVVCSNTKNTQLSTPSDWAKSEIDKAVEAGLIPAELQSEWQTPITRFDFCKLAYILYTKQRQGAVIISADNKFNDIGELSSSDKDIVGTVAALGIVNGYEDGSFKPYKEISRQEAAVMLMRTAKVLGADNPLLMPVTYEDCNDVANWAREGIEYVYSSNIMNGTSVRQDGFMGTTFVTFSPYDTYTREQAMVTFYRLYERILNKTHNNNEDSERELEWVDLTPNESGLVSSIERVEECVAAYKEALEQEAENVNGKAVNDDTISNIADMYNVTPLDSSKEGKSAYQKQKTYIDQALYEYTSELSDFDFSDERDESFVEAIADVLSTGVFKGTYGSYNIKINPLARAGKASVGLIECQEGFGTTYSYEFNTTTDATLDAITSFNKESGKLIEELGEEALDEMVNDISRIFVGATISDYITNRLSKKANETAQLLGLGDINNLLGELEDWYEAFEGLKDLDEKSLADSWKDIRKLSRMEISVEDKYLSNEVVEKTVQDLINALDDLSSYAQAMYENK